MTTASSGFLDLLPEGASIASSVADRWLEYVENGKVTGDDIRMTAEELCRYVAD